MFNISPKKLRTNLADFGSSLDIKSTGRWLFYCALVGMAAGFLALLFTFFLDVVQELTLEQMAGIKLERPKGEEIDSLFTLSSTPLAFNTRWLVLIIPAFGGLISGLIIHYWAPDAGGLGTDSVIKAYHEKSAQLRNNTPITKLLASTFTIGTGGSAGHEGPIAQIGAGFGSFLSKKLNISVKERRILMMAGLAGGIGAMFKAPIGAALFSSEVIYQNDFESEGLMAAIMSSIAGYSVYASVTGWESIFTFQPVHFTNPLELPLFIFLALILTVCGMIFIKIFHGVKPLFSRIDIPLYLKPVIGGFLVGGIGYFYPQVLGSSYGSLQEALNGNLTITFMLILVVLKMFATTFTVQSGGSGGVFAPTLVIGGLLGGVIGLTLESFFPATVTNPEAYVLVGMASFFSGVANVPVSSTILITEMSQSYGLIVPLIFASSIVYIGTHNWSIYKEQLINRVSSASFRDMFLTEIMDRLKVNDAYENIPDMPVINHRCRVHRILKHFTEADTLILPVENDNKEVVGMISLYDVRSLLQEEVGDVIIAADIMVPPKLLHPRDSFGMALQYFRESGEPELPVLKEHSDNEFIGVLSERDFLLTYERKMSEAGLK